MKTMFSLGLSKLTAIILLLLLGPVTYSAQGTPTPDTIATEDGALKIFPINHATLALQWKDRTIYVDPVGGAKAFQGLPNPDLILITDIHGDHFSKETLSELAGPQTKLVGPSAVVEQLPADLRTRTTTLSNGQTQELMGIQIEA